MKNSLLELQPQLGLSSAQVDEFRHRGFLHLAEVLSSDILDQAQRIMEPWVEHFTEMWEAQGLLHHDYAELDFGHRFLTAWRHAGRPHFRRRPNHFLMNHAMYDFLRTQVFLDVAEQLLGTPNISVHGIFNARPQLPNDPLTQTPWHQDSQYWSLDYGDPEPDLERRTTVLTMWMPLQDVDEQSGCLGVMSLEDTAGKVFEPYDYDYASTGFLGLSPDDVAAYPHIPIRMRRGDLLIFGQRTPHAAMENHSDHARWSMDIRYEATQTATVVGRRYGFVAQDLRAPEAVTPVEDWVSKQLPPDYVSLTSVRP